jgi:hypothetical protein
MTIKYRTPLIDLLALINISIKLGLAILQGHKFAIDPIFSPVIISIHRPIMQFCTHPLQYRTENPFKLLKQPVFFSYHSFYFIIFRFIRLKNKALIYPLAVCGWKSSVHGILFASLIYSTGWERRHCI